MRDRRVHAVALLLLLCGCHKGPPVGSEPARRGGVLEAPARAAAIEVGRLRWDASEHPIGILRLEPRLEWQLASSERGQRQTAYQILVASDAGLLAAGKADVWDSGKVSSSESVNVLYRGPGLVARQRGVWTVRAWDEQDRPSRYAPPAAWEVGPWDEEVEGDWIGRASKQGESARERERSVTYFRRPFTVPAGFKEARLYATAFGLYEMSLNGRRVGDELLTPGFTDYDKRVLVQTRDITALVHPGENVVGGVLAGGWCTARLQGRQGRCGNEPPRLRVALELTLPDGTRQTIESDDEWKYADGPLLTAQLFEGESYDARREQPGWDAPGFDDKAWLPAVEYDGDTERNVYPDRGAAVRLGDDRPSVAVSEPSPGRYVFDVGQSIVGWPRLNVQAPAGTQLSLRYADELASDGALKRQAGVPAVSDHYVARGAGPESWEPRFSLRQFRYVEVQGLGSRPAPAAIVGRSVRTDMPVTGTLETSDAALNQLFAGIAAEQDRAFLSVPSWGAHAATQPGGLLEAQLFAMTSCLNRDVQRFYRKWIDDIRDAQLQNAAYPEAAPAGEARDGGAISGSAGVLVPWALYRCYGDRTELDAHLTSMGRWLNAVVARHPDLIWSGEPATNRGDPGESGPATDPALLATAELAYSADALGRMLRSGGPSLEVEAARYEKVAADSRAAFQRAFVLPGGKLKSDTQTAYAVAIARGLLEGQARERAGQELVASLERGQHRPRTGLIGRALLLPALSLIGRDDLAYALLRQLAQAGERAGGSELGGVGEWMYDAIGGIALDPGAPAGRHVWVRPRPGSSGLSRARASFASLYGPIETDWVLEGRTFRLKVKLPVGSSATVSLPDGTKRELESGSHELSAAVP